MGKASSETNYYVGIDVGGTKIQASLVEEAGIIRAGSRCPTPRDSDKTTIINAIIEAINDVLTEKKLKSKDMRGIGIAIPGVVDPDQGYVVVTPNMNLTDTYVVKELQKKFDCPIMLGNDCNLGTLGEAWLGTGRKSSSLVAMLVGTGIGAGFVQNGRIYRGTRKQALEVGHMIMAIDGPECGCGNKGCYEALASRTAIERDIRQAVAGGRKTILSDLLESDDLSLIRSGALRNALNENDEVVTEIMQRASRVIGFACMTIRHLLDPELIVLGGGVMEACSDFMLPIIQEIVISDQLTEVADDDKILLACLGDDAVVLGGVALAREAAGRDPFNKKYDIAPLYEEAKWTSSGKVKIEDTTCEEDVHIRVDGAIKRRAKQMQKADVTDPACITAAELNRLCRGGPHALFIGQGSENPAELDESARDFLRLRAIDVEILPTPEAVKAYNKSKKRKAALFCL